MYFVKTFLVKTEFCTPNVVHRRIDNLILLRKYKKICIDWKCRKKMKLRKTNFKITIKHLYDWFCFANVGLICCRNLPTTLHTKQRTMLEMTTTLKLRDPNQIHLWKQYDSIAMTYQRYLLLLGNNVTTWQTCANYPLWNHYDNTKTI